MHGFKGVEDVAPQHVHYRGYGVGGGGRRIPDECRAADYKSVAVGGHELHGSRDVATAHEQFVLKSAGRVKFKQLGCKLRNIASPVANMMQSKLFI